MDDNQFIVVKVARSVIWSIGTKIWYVVKADTGEHYQRWSHAMDATDEVLMLAQAGDVLVLLTEAGFHGDDIVTKITAAKFHQASDTSQPTVDQAIALLTNMYDASTPV